MRIYDWDDVKAEWPDWETPEYRAELRSARRELELGMRIRELRLAAGVSQKELARMVGSSQPAIARLEAGGGMPRIETLERVAQALGAELVIGLRGVRDSTFAPSKRPGHQVASLARKTALVEPGPVKARTKTEVPVKTTGKAPSARPTGAARTATKAPAVKTVAAKAPSGDRATAEARARLAAGTTSSPAPKASPKGAKVRETPFKKTKPSRSSRSAAPS